LPIPEERSRRANMWTSLLRRGGPRGVQPALLRQLRIYGGARGIWVDKGRTGTISPNGTGVTVGLLATEGAYPDLLRASEGTYRYPDTQIPGWDAAGIAATKAAGDLELAVFLVTRSAAEPDLRSVRLARVTGWNDDLRHFVLSIGDETFLH
jgi:putative restriction endonuclease